MFKKETEYALRALVYICQQNELKRKPGVIEVAEEILAPPSFTAKILQRLAKNGLVSSQKGKGGGFFFNSDQNHVILQDVVLLVEGQKVFTSCGFGLGKCDDNNPCPIHDQYIKVRSELTRIFQENTIRDLAQKV